MVNSSIITAIGFMFALRMCGQMFIRKFFSRNEVISIVIFLSLMVFASTFFRQNTVLVHFLTSIMIIATPILVICIKELHFQRFFEKQIISIFDQLTLQMQMGRSFRDALTSVVKQNEVAGTIFGEIGSAVAYKTSFRPHQTSPKIQRLFFELSDIENSSFRAIDRLKAFRYTYQVEEKFKQKSKQATIQTKVQAVFIGLLYFGMMVFHFYSFSDKNLASGVVISSLLLFFVGILLIWNTGKRFRWKV